MGYGEHYQLFLTWTETSGEDPVVDIYVGVDDNDDVIGYELWWCTRCDTKLHYCFNSFSTLLFVRLRSRGYTKRFIIQSSQLRLSLLQSSTINAVL